MSLSETVAPPYRNSVIPLRMKTMRQLRWTKKTTLKKTHSIKTKYYLNGWWYWSISVSRWAQVEFEHIRQCNDSLTVKSEPLVQFKVGIGVQWVCSVSDNPLSSPCLVVSILCDFIPNIP
jgi:hypothetical protein